MDIEKHIIELETKISYQEHMIHDLNEVVTRQQKQIDLLEADMKRIREHLKDSSESQLARPEEETPPPHY
ncbi:MAG: SlyX family protein [Mariprofundaceae bacterium]|nr:SlyX family protein [Mariprofundaceae bacterium]